MSDAPLEYPRKNRADPWHREPGMSFSSLERELFAKARARGCTIKAASSDAGIAIVTGTQYERHEAMRKRISELRQGAEDFVGVSKAWIVAQLKRNADEAREEKAFKSSNEALQMIYKIISEDRDVSANMARALPHTVSAADIKARLKASFKPDVPPRALPQETGAIESDEGAE
jgi:hypothetical protein